MEYLKEILAVGSIAFDTIDTPNGKRERILGGSSTYFSLAASHYSKVSLIGIVGNDFSEKEWNFHATLSSICIINNFVNYVNDKSGCELTVDRMTDFC